MLEWLAKSPYAIWVSESSGWAIALTVHALGTATVLGLIFIIGLRLFGLFRTMPFTAMGRLIAVVWVGVVCQIISGLTLWMTKPAQYLSDAMFDTKIALVITGIIVTLYFQIILRREAAAWEAAGTVTSRGVKLGAAVALLWAGVTIGGRLTAYLGSLYPS